MVGVCEAGGCACDLITDITQLACTVVSIKFALNFREAIIITVRYVPAYCSVYNS